MGRILYVHWNDADSEALIRQLREEGHDVLPVTEEPSRAWNTIRSEPFDALVISLSRPSAAEQVAASTKTERLKDTMLLLVGTPMNEDGGILARLRREHPRARFLDPDEVAAEVRGLLETA